MSLIAEDLELLLSPGTIFATRALKAISFTLNPGQVVGLIGHTGSGKSSLLQVLTGLQQPTMGRVLLEGMPLYQTDTDRSQLRKLVGVSFQYPEHQLFEETVRQEIAFGLKRQRLDEDEIRVRTDEAMDLVRLDARLLGRSPFELSGGQMRRVALASTFALKPRYLFLDEPVAGLDPRGRDEILESIQDYRRRNNSCIVFVSHSMEDVAHIADRLLVLNSGRLVLDATPREVFQSEECLAEAGLEPPEAFRLMRALRRCGLPVSEDSILNMDQAYEQLEVYLRSRRA